MTEVVQIYLGNSIEDATLLERIDRSRSSELLWEVHVSKNDSIKGRIHAHTTNGVAVGIVKNRDRSLREGDVFETDRGKLLLIHLQEQKVMVLRFTESVSDRAIQLIHLGHVLGNHHWPIMVQNNKIYIEQTADVEVMETTIHHFQIPGLQIDWEFRSSAEHLDFSKQDIHHHHHHK